MATRVEILGDALAHLLPWSYHRGSDRLEFADTRFKGLDSGEVEFVGCQFVDLLAGFACARFPLVSLFAQGFKVTKKLGATYTC
jgi:hypothetical protein